MGFMYVIGEDALCCALGQRLVRDVLRWKTPIQPIDTRGVTRLVASLDRYTQLGRHNHVLCVVDTDGGCPVDLLRKWLPQPVPARFQLRFAVTEAESWLMADKSSFSSFFHVNAKHVPDAPDEIKDAKRRLLWLASKSKRRQFRAEIVSITDPTRPGTGYNQHLCAFASNHWQPGEAATRSPSLARALARLTHLAGLETSEKP